MTVVLQIILFSYGAIALGILLLLAGFILRQRGEKYDRYLIGAGAVLVILGLLGIGGFIAAFG